MNLSTIGSVNQYAKGVALKTQWNLKKKSGDVTAHKKGLDDFLSVSSSASRTEQDADNEKLQKITSKVNVGAKLTEKEMEYLKAKNPQLYEKLRQIEREQKAYEEALRRCKTKDEAQNLHMARVSEAMQAAKSGDGTAAYRMNRMTESLNAFTETDDYQKLSTEAEQSLERKEQREAERPEAAGEATEAERVEKAERPAPAEEAKPPVEADAPEAESERPAAEPAPRFGAGAYASRQGAEEREEVRRKAFSADA